MIKNRMMLAGLVAALGLITSACQIDIERNTDGSFQVEAVISEADIATEIAFGIDDVDAETLAIDLRAGHALFQATGPNEDDPTQTDTVTFRLELFVVDGHLGAEISDAIWNGIDVPEQFVAEWNDEIAGDLERSARKDKDSTLVAVVITDDQVRFEFQVDPQGSRSNS